MKEDLKQCQFARIEGQNITRARLEQRFKGPITDTGVLEKEIELVLTTNSIPCAPWRSAEIEKTAFREGVRLAALEFYWERREQVRVCEAELQVKAITLMFPTLPNQFFN